MSPESPADLNTIIEMARRTSETGQSDEAARLWRQVLALDKNNIEAQKFLQSYSQRRLSEQTIGRRISELRIKATSNQLTELKDALRIAHELLSSEVLDETSFETVAHLEREAKDKLENIRAVAGEIESMAALGLLKEAIAELERLIRYGVGEIVDREGNIVPSSLKLAEYNQAYAAHCTTKASEYLARAELSLPSYPKVAADILSKALTEFDRADAEMRAAVERRLMEVQEQISRWERAKELVQEGIQERDPTKRLQLFKSALIHYPHFEGIRELVEEAEKDVCAVLLFDLKHKVLEGKQLLEDGRFDQALELANQGRREALLAPDICRSLFTNLDNYLLEIDEITAEARRAIGQQRAKRDDIIKHLNRVKYLIGQGAYDEAETALTSVLNQITDPDLLDQTSRLQVRISAERKIASLLQELQAAITNQEIERAEELLATIPEDVAVENAQLVALRQQLNIAKEQWLKKQKDTEEQIRLIVDNAVVFCQQRLFVASIKTLQQVTSLVNDLPQERRAHWETLLLGVREQVSHASKVWSDYAQARTYVWEAEGTQKAEYVEEAIQLLLRVMRYQPVDTVVGSIQQEARELYDRVLLGVSVMQGNLDEVEKRLLMIMATKPDDSSVIRRLHSVRATKYLQTFAEQADERRRIARREAQGWYIASLVSGVIFAGLFVFAVLHVLLTHPENTLSYLTPLYTFVPGLLSALFLKQYEDANKRLDEEQSRLWEQIKEFQNKQLNEPGSVSYQPSISHP
ncbi:MAG: hypothetical protein QXS54_12755 [Candidatus Methanomethylicaceae archaeon]